MRRKLLVSVLFLLSFFTSSYSQWKPVKSLEGGEGRAIYKDNNTLYLMVDNFGVMKSIDSGSTWKRILKAYIPNYGVFSHMSADQNMISVDTLLSVDTGNTWQSLQVPLNNMGYHFFEVFKGKIYYAGTDSIAISDDDGNTWSKYKLPHLGVYPNRNRLMKYNDSLFLVSQNYAIYSTNDSGITWDSICPTPSIFYELDYLAIKGDTLFYKTHYYLYRSINRGNTWTQIYYLFGALFENDSLFLAKGDSVYVSSDLGNTLNFVAQREYLLPFNFVKAGNQLVLPSFFWGALRCDLNTSQLTQSVEGIYGVPVVSITNSHDSIFVYSYSPLVVAPKVVYYSFNNGLTWSLTISPATTPFFRAMAYFDRALYLLIYKDIYKFDILNQSWSNIGYTQNHSCNDISVDTSGIFCSDFSDVLKFPLQGGSYSLYSTIPPISHAAINNGYIYGVNPTDVLVSPLLPVPQWTTINSGLPGPLNQGIFAFNNSKVYLGGGKGVYRSQPPAYNWIYTGLFDKGLHKLATHGDAVFAATHEKGICVLRNDTSVWDPVNFDLPRGDYDSTHIFAFYSLACSDSGVFTGGATYPDCGLWYRPYSEFNVPISTEIEETILTASSFSIYPNPANSSITLSLPSSSGQTIELRIYNTLGKQIYVEKSAITKGKFEKEINVEKWSDGIYFLQLKTKEGNLNRKVVVQH